MNKGKTAEDYVHHFAKTAYLKHWCFPNPIDESGDRKEICDLLILFNDTCIIVSIKNYDLNGDYVDTTKQEIDRFSEDAGAVYMYKTDYKYEKIIILGAKYDLSESKYGIVLRTGDEKEEGNKNLDQLCSNYGCFQNMVNAKINFKEFPTD